MKTRDVAVQKIVVKLLAVLGNMSTEEGGAKGAEGFASAKPKARVQAEPCRRV